MKPHYNSFFYCENEWAVKLLSMASAFPYSDGVVIGYRIMTRPKRYPAILDGWADISYEKIRIYKSCWNYEVE